MIRSDYLNPESVRNQCSQAVSRMEEDNQALEAVGRCIEDFSKDPEIESQSFYTLKQQLNGYQTIIEAIKIANALDIRDFKRLSVCVGNEVLDGEIIFCQMENALNMQNSYLSNESLYRSKMLTEEESFFYLYYSQMAKIYCYLAENSQKLYSKWQEKAERFDEISADTNRLFTDSESISVLIQKGLSELSGSFQSGTYTYDKNSVWRSQLKNKCLRLTMCFEDKGGDQNGPYAVWQRGIDSDREYIRNIVHGYKEYADYSDDEIAELLMKLKSEGCGYAAFANIIADEYRGKEDEFKSRFGFSLFSKNAIGNEYIDYNRLILDLYCASDNRNENGVYDAGEDISVIKGTGTSQESRIYRFEKYMKDYGVEVEIKNIQCSAGDVYEKCKEETEKGSRMIISICPVRLEDAEGEHVYMDIAHAMSVTGFTEDGRIEVSSWGGKYYITPEDPDYLSSKKNQAGEAYIRLQSIQFKEE